MVHSGITPVSEWQFASIADTTDTTAVPMVAAKAGTRHRVMAVQASNTSAVATVVQLRSGTTVIGSFYLAGTAGAASQIFPMPLMGNLNADINFINVTNGAGVRVSAQGVTEVFA